MAKIPWLIPRTSLIFLVWPPVFSVPNLETIPNFIFPRWMQVPVQNTYFYTHQFFLYSYLVSRGIPVSCLFSILSSLCSRSLPLPHLGSPTELFCLFYLPNSTWKACLPSCCLQFASFDGQTSQLLASTSSASISPHLGSPTHPVSETAHWNISDDLGTNNFSFSPSSRHHCSVIYRSDPAHQGASPSSMVYFYYIPWILLLHLLVFHLPSLQVPFLLL